MGTDLDEPVIIATLTARHGEAAGPLLIDGCHRLYKAARLGREHLPSLVLTAAETLAIRHDAVIGPAPAGRRNGGPGHDHASPSGTTWPTTAKAGTPGCWTATSPAIPWSVSSPTRPTPPGGSPEAIAEEAFAICNGHPRDAGGEDLARRYYERELRSLSVGDVVAVGEVPLAVGSAGWTLVRGGLNEVRADEHGTRPCPAPGGATPGEPPLIPAERSRTGHDCP